MTYIFSYKEQWYQILCKSQGKLSILLLTNAMNRQSEPQSVTQGVALPKPKKSVVLKIQNWCCAQWCHLTDLMLYMTRICEMYGQPVVQACYLWVYSVLSLTCSSWDCCLAVKPRSSLAYNKEMYENIIYKYIDMMCDMPGAGVTAETKQKGQPYHAYDASNTKRLSWQIMPFSFR